MGHISDWMDGGIWPVQFHDRSDDRKISERMMVTACRVERLPNPTKGGPAANLEVAIEGPQGTIGDVHPWFFWQTADPTVRGMGMWSMAHSGLAVEGGDGGFGGGNKTGKPVQPSGLLPFRVAHDTDSRFRLKYPNWPKCLNSIPQGTMMMVMPGTYEWGQSEHMLHADPRLVAVNTEGPGEAGTLVVDLQPEGVMCMRGSTSHLPRGSKPKDADEPGVVGRAARLQSMMRVIPLGAWSLAGAGGAGKGNAIAWNHSLAGVDDIPGYGMCWVRFKAGGGQGGGGPTTGPRDPVGPSGGVGVGGGGGGGGGKGGTGNPWGKGPRTPPVGGPSIGSPLKRKWGTNRSKPGGTFGRAPGSYITAPDGPGLGLPGGGGSGGGSGGAGGGGNGSNPCQFGEFFEKAAGNEGTMLLAATPAYGPTTGGSGKGDKHYFGNDKDRNPIVSGHLDTNAYFHMDTERDAPLEFLRDPYPEDVSSYENYVEVNLVYDRQETHRWASGELPGLWRWYTTTPYKEPDDIPRTVVPPNTGGPGTPTTPGPTTPSRPGPAPPPPPGPPTGGKPNRPGKPVTPPGGRPNTQPRGPVKGPNTGGRGDQPKPWSPPRPWTPDLDRDPDSWINRFRRQTGVKPGPNGEPKSGNSNFGGNGEVGFVRRNDSLGLVGQVSASHLSLYEIMHPHKEGFAGLSFRPQFSRQGFVTWLHNPNVPAWATAQDERGRPQVLSAYAWGAMGQGEWLYHEGPESSRARGGTADGGLLFCPSAYELEDYFGINSNADVHRTGDDDAAAGSGGKRFITTSYVMAAPGVSFALGTPTAAGSLASRSVKIAQLSASQSIPVGGSDGNEPLVIQQFDSTAAAVTLMRMELDQSSSEQFVSVAGTQFLRIPRGTQAQRPAAWYTKGGGEIRVETNPTGGAAQDTLSWYCAQDTTWKSLRGTGSTDGGTQVGTRTITGSTYSTVQHLQDIFHSAGRTSGGNINDAGGGNITVDVGTGLIRPTDDPLDELLWFDHGTLTSTAIPANSVRYVGVQYNAGSPQVVVSSTQDWDNNTEYELGTVINEGGVLHIQQAPHNVGDHAGLMISRLFETMPYRRDDRNGGLALGETGTRNVTVTAGALWDKLNRYAIAAIDTSAADTFTTYYRDGVGGWTATTLVGQWPNTQYDDGSGTLATMSANRYANLWWYIEPDGNLIMLYPQAEHANLANAEDETPPSTVPLRAQYHSRLIGRLIFQKSDGVATEIQSTFVDSFGSSVVTDHGALAGLADDDHTQYLLIDGTRAMTGDLSAGGNDIYNVQTLAVGHTTVTTEALIEVQANPATTPDDAKSIALTNDTASTTGNVKYSPMIRFQGRAEDGFLAADTTVEWRMYLKPVEVAFDIPRGDFVWESDSAAAGWRQEMYYDGENRFLYVGAGGTATSGLRAENAWIGGWVGSAGFTMFGHYTVKGTTGSYALLQQSDGSTFLNAATSKIISFRINNSNTMTMDSDSLNFADDKYIELGTGGDARISYNGSDLIIEPDNVGTGAARVTGDVEITGESRIEGDVTIGSSAAPNAGASLDLTATTKSLILNRITSGSEPTGVAGMLHYDSSNNVLLYYNGSSWQTVATA